jgi:hypothetical protein
MDPSAAADDLNELSVLVNVAHRLLLGLREDLDTDPTLQSIVDDLDSAHEDLDRALETIGTALDRVEKVIERPRVQRPPLH